jgi:hypothetical protein
MAKDDTKRPPTRIKAFWRTTKQRKTLNGSLDRFKTPRVRKLQWRTAQAGFANKIEVPLDPARLDEDDIRRHLRLAQRLADIAGVPRPSFPFEIRDVVAIHTRHADHGDGVWFRLASGRVFRDNGEPDTTRVDAYD